MAMAQEDPSKSYNYYNNGFNFMFEWDGTLNNNIAFHGPEFTFGCQSNSNIFLGGGIKFHLGKIRNNYGAECGDNDFFGMIVPYLCFKYNILSQKRATPYIDTRIGLDLCDVSGGAALNSTTMAGIRIGVGHCSRAINIAAGWSYADMSRKKDETGHEHSFMLRCGIEY